MTDTFDQTACDRKHEAIAEKQKGHAWLTTAILAFCTLLVVLVFWSIGASMSASSAATEVKIEHGKHAAAQEVRDEHVAKTLGTIAKDVKDIWDHNHAGGGG